jgi:demethylmenaquinone methyltransferase/2-methoxy-6-polyprenyl-1,4-benzoquinol methylase
MSIQSIPTGNTCGETGSRSYEWIASIYDWTVATFTGGKNLATRLAQLDDLKRGDRVLYIGVGSGEDALEAARNGVEITCLDLSAGMVEQARDRFAEAQLPGEFVCDDIMHYAPEQPFDAVVCNFFLNIFTRPVMEQVLARAVSLVRPGGKLLIADFAPARGNILLRAAHRIVYRVSNRIYWAMGLCPMHPIYVYADYYPELGLTVETTHRFRLFRKGPWLFHTTTAVKGQPTGRATGGAPLPEREEAAPTGRHFYDLAAASAAS